MIEVVSGAIVRQGRLLLSQRPPSRDYPFHWETPGGKVDVGESHHAAVIRELREELGLYVEIVAERPFWCGEVKRDGRDSVFVLFYECAASGEPEPREGQGFGWFASEEIERLALVPGNVAALEALKDLLS